jgi:hypothetical protein
VDFLTTIRLVSGMTSLLVTSLTGDSKTDTINRALQIYAYLEQVTSKGGSIYVREAGDTELERLKIF